MNTHANKWAPFTALPLWERKGVDRMATEAGHTLHSGSTAAQIQWAIGYHKGVTALVSYPRS